MSTAFRRSLHTLSLTASVILGGASFASADSNQTSQQKASSCASSMSEKESCEGVKVKLYNNCNKPLMLQNARTLAEKSYAFRKEKSESRFFTVQTQEKQLKLHYRLYQRPNAKRAVVFIPGSRAPEVKHTQLIEELYESMPDTDFYILEHRSHGRSEGTTTEPLVHVDSYQDFIDDISGFFTSEIQIKQYEALTLTGHSTSNLMIMATLMQQPELQKKVSKVILTSPSIEMATDLIGKINYWGRIPVSAGAFVIRQFLGLKLLKPDALAPGYTKTYKKQDPNKLPPMVKNHEFYYRYHSYVDIEQEEGASPYPAFVEKLGPTNQWIVEMGKASHYVRNSPAVSQISIPVVMVMASQDYLVSNRSALAYCKKLKNCRSRIADGFHDFIFDPKEISYPFFEELRKTEKMEN